MNTQGILLINLGSPDSPSIPDVRRYLREFLMDKRVMDAPWPIRFGVVHGCILPFRPKVSAHAYRSIWQADGSPLVTMGRWVQSALAARMEIPVELAMRYRNPSVESAIEKLQNDGVNELLLIPLFPHYAMSSYETAVEKVRSVIQLRAPEMNLSVLRPYYDHPEYIEALVASSRSFLEPDDYEHLLFSFHGLPERHLRKADPTGHHCLKMINCCETESPAHSTCYRAQCFKTVKAFARAIHLSESKYSVAFQSRLGRDPWMQPYTSEEIQRLARSGVKRLRVICPAFVADCLETLEEIGMRGRELFLEAGGKEFTMIPCLNDHPRWIDALTTLARNCLDVSEAHPGADPHSESHYPQQLITTPVPDWD